MELNYRAAKREAEAKLKAIIKEIPNELTERENRIFNQISTSHESSFSKLEGIYAFMDDLLSFISLYITCHKGCSNCCHLKVSVSTIEADYIQDKTGIKQTLTMESKSLFGTSCPFLRNGACSIYKYRPYVCRRHMALFTDPKWCSLELCGLYSFPSIRFTEVENSFDFLVSSGGGGYYFDIRQLFKYSKIA